MPKGGRTAQVGSLRHHGGAREVKGTNFLGCLAPISWDVSAFNTVIPVHATLGELFERKSLHIIIIICDVLAGLRPFIHRCTIFPLLGSLPVAYNG